MKEKDNGISGLQLKISENNAPPIEIESKFPSNDKITEKSEGIANKKSEDQNQIIKDQNQKNIQQNEDIDLLVEKNQLKDNKIKKLSDNEKNKEIKTDKNQLKVKNGINKIDMENNLIVLNKKNLKELNGINKEINKKNQIGQKKGEAINIFGNKKFYYTNKDINNTINKSYDIYTKKIENLYENSGTIISNMNFPSDVIEKFFERKKSNKKENKESNYFNLFGNNPLERLKEIQEKINDSPPTKNGKIGIKQFKTNQKKLKDEDCKIQNYLKLFPVFNCPELKIFKFNQFYYYNRIYEDKNNYYNKKRKNNINKNKTKEEIEKEKDESEEDTINRINKKKFINKKRNKSKNKESKNYCEV